MDADYPNTGVNLACRFTRWPAVHRFDAASLYRLAAESAVPGECFHAVAEDGIRFKQIAEVIGDELDIPVRSISKDAAVDQFGWLTRFAAMDSPASSDITRSRLDWDPQQHPLLTSLRNHDYFIDAEAGMVNMGH